MLCACMYVSVYVCLCEGVRLCVSKRVKLVLTSKFLANNRSGCTGQTSCVSLISKKNAASNRRYTRTVKVMVSPDSRCCSHYITMSEVTGPKSLP